MNNYNFDKTLKAILPREKLRLFLELSKYTHDALSQEEHAFLYALSQDQAVQDAARIVLEADWLSEPPKAL